MRLAIALLLASAAAAQNPAALIPEMEKTLKENILGFWLPRSIDRENGGYIINFGPQGEARGPGNRTLVTQSRMVWFFARTARAGYGGQELLDAANHGYIYLREKMWDPRHGGFYWEVNPRGQPTRDAKHLYGQAFALYALSEYALASGRKDVLDFAVELFHLLEKKSHDPVYGGYIEAFHRDWTPVPEGGQTPMGVAGLKLMNTHLHLLEALTTFWQAGKLPLARERLRELIDIQSNAVVRKDLGAGVDKFARDWTPRMEGDWARISYGHDIENIWLLMEAADAAGISNYPFLDLYRTLFAYSRKYGYDEARGGFFDTGLPGKPADRRNSIWWVQAEALVGALRMYAMTRERPYWDVFAQTWEFVKSHHIDWEHGEWHEVVSPDGQVRGGKAHGWKAAYHNGRAMIECIEALRKLR
jgi:cellobiose epimerase